MSGAGYHFADRAEAGRILGDALSVYAGRTDVLGSGASEAENNPSANNRNSKESDLRGDGGNCRIPSPEARGGFHYG